MAKDSENWYPGKHLQRVTDRVAQGIIDHTLIDEAAQAGVNVLSKVATPIVRLGRGALGGAKRVIFQREKKEKPKGKAQGGVVTGKKKSGPRGVGCAKRGHGRALS